LVPSAVLTIRGGLRLLEVEMKKLALAAVLSVAATAAVAGGLAEPVIEPVVIVEETASTSGGLVVPLLLLAVIAAVAAN
jgi:hypothetical protein